MTTKEKIGLIMATPLLIGLIALFLAILIVPIWNLIFHFDWIWAVIVIVEFGFIGYAILEYDNA